MIHRVSRVSAPLVVVVIASPLAACHAAVDGATALGPPEDGGAGALAPGSGAPLGHGDAALPLGPTPSA